MTNSTQDRQIQEGTFHLPLTVQFKIWRTRPYVRPYSHGGTGLVLLDDTTGEVIAVATVRVEGLAEDELAIKDYSENEGMLDALLRAGLVQSPHRTVRSGYVEIPIVHAAPKWQERVFGYLVKR